MGMLRVILAISVVFAHLSVDELVGGQLAVQLFFLISGYLISFVLMEAKTYSKVKYFYLNRALRIFPLYWCIAILALLFNACMHTLSGDNDFFNTIESLPAGGPVAFGIVNLILFGQDQALFLAVHDGVFSWTGNFLDSDVLLYKALLIPQSWSLGLELTFYLFAPAILKRKSLLIILFLGSICLRLAFIGAGFGFADPWVYRFFPTELALFLAGSISHQFLSQRYSKALIRSARLNVVIVSIIISLNLAFKYLVGPVPTKSLILIALTALALPFLFNFQTKSKFDAYLGQLSYPIYLWHMLVISVLSWVTSITGNPEWRTPVSVVTFTLVISILSVDVLEKNVGKLRAKLKTRKAIQHEPRQSLN